MMKKTIFSAALLSVVAFAAEPKADAADIWKYIHQNSPYWNWKTIDDKSKMYESCKPHGPYLTTYVNDKAYEAIKNNAKELPYGSIIVKENYNAKKQLKMLGIKYKVKDFNPKDNDWYWIKVKPDSDVQASGVVQGCIKCHSTAKESDYVHTGHDYQYALPVKK